MLPRTLLHPVSDAAMHPAKTALHLQAANSMFLMLPNGASPYSTRRTNVHIRIANSTDVYSV